MERNAVVITPRLEARDPSLATNKVLRNTYLLLSATLAFSAVMAGVCCARTCPTSGPGSR